LREQIFGMTEDKSGRFWIATSGHVLRVPRDKLVSGAVKEADVHEFGRADGLESTKGVKRSRSMVWDSTGRIWISLGSGLSVVDPSKLHDDSVPALPHIEAITVDDKTLNLAASVPIPPSPRRITFEYTGLSLAAPGRIRFRYSLESFDSGWSQPVAVRQAVYTNLGPGTYRFRLVASNSEGLWNGPEARITVSVAPTYYQTNWFRAFLVLAFLALLWISYQLRLRQLQRKFNVGLEARVNERTRIARELHDTLLQTFHGLMFQFQAVRNLMTRRPDEAMRSLDEAINDTQKALAESRDAIQGLRFEPTAEWNLAELLVAESRELARAGNGKYEPPTFALTEEGERRSLSPNAQSDVRRIALELLRNAYRHAGAHRIEAEVRYGDQMLRLRIRDDGKGIDPEVLRDGGRAGHWGIPGVRERAERVGALVDFWSEGGAGTEVQVEVPASIAYEKLPRNGIWSRLLGK
jgi:signal transduction histidine kinase